MIIRQLEALFGFRIDTAQFNKATSAIDNFADNANTAMSALAGHFAIQTIKDFVNTTTEAMANVGRMAGMLGISTQSLEELRYAAEKSGVAIDTLDDSMKELQIRAVDAKTGQGEAAEAFQALGIITTNAAGQMREPLELLSEVADKLRKLPTQSDRIWVVDSMFGDQGAEMLKILEGGSEGLLKMRSEAQELGYTLDNDTVQSAIAFRQAISALKAVLSSIVRTVTKSLLPAMTSFAQGSTSLWMSVSGSFAKLNDETSAIRAAFIGLGVVLAGLAIKVVIALAPMIVIGALIAGAALLIDDLWTALDGGESVSKRVFETLMGWFQSLKSWVLVVAGDIWDFLPAELQHNLTAALSLAKIFCESLSSFLHIALSRAWGFALEEFNAAFNEVKTLALKVFDEVSHDLTEAFLYAARAFVDHISEAIENVKNIILGIKNVLADAVPDFVKKGFSAAVGYVGRIGSKYDQKPSHSNVIPQAPHSAHIQNHSNQNVSVSVNVKTGAGAHEIGSEVSRALRKALEKERVNAFMGVNKYAF